MEIKKYPVVSRNQSLLTAELLRSILVYDTETGLFYWRDYKPNRHMNKALGNNNGTGYVQIRLTINGVECGFLAHRLAWLYVNGTWPDGGLDHIDRDRANNRITNLRQATISQNNRNRTKILSRKSQREYTSGFMGVSWHKAANKWRAQININGSRVHIGAFDSEQDAALAYNQAALKLDAEHCRQNQLA
jgi:hypothetical protein